MIDFLIVGAGLTGATAARLLTDAGASCLVIDRRGHIAGNCYDEPHDDYYINRYGGHIFHTNSKKVWDFAQRFSEWIPYEHRVKASYKGKIYTLPPNKLTAQQLGLSGDKWVDGEIIRDVFFAGYSWKQWEMPLEKLPGNVISRIPIRDDYDDRYFTDKYQAVPKHGYTRWIEAMLRNIPVELNTSYPADIKARRVVYTGSLDALYDYRFGRLPYRSLRWETEIIQDGIGCATMNYTDYEPEYTRRMEWRYFGNRQNGQRETAVTTEYPQAYDGDNEPMYPINTVENNLLFKRYQLLAHKDGLLNAGRLGTYRYLDMHQAIGNGMALVKRIVA